MPLSPTSLARYVNVAEKIIVLGLIVVLLLGNRLQSQQEAYMILLSALAGVMFLKAFTPLDVMPTDKQEVQWGFGELLFYTIVPKVLCIGSAVACMGILFYLLKFPGYQQQLVIGSTALGAALAVVLFYFLRGFGRTSTYLGLVYRALAFFIVAVFIQIQ